jgi:hypothetical protein
MRTVSALLAFVLTASPAIAEQGQATPIRDAAEKAVTTMAAQDADRGGGKGTLFWPGVALGVAGITTAILGTTVLRVEDRSAGHSPAGLYQACVTQKTSNPAYAGNDCDALKGQNVKVLWGGVALGALGAVMMIGSAHSGAELGPRVVRFVHRVRF